MTQGYFWSKKNGLVVKGWDLFSRDSRLIPHAGSHFWFGCGMPFILAMSMEKNTGGRLCVGKEKPILMGKDIGHNLSTMASALL